MKIIFTLHVFFVFCNISVSQTKFTDFGNHLALNKQFTYPKGSESNSDFSSSASNSGFDQGIFKLPVHEADSTFEGSSVFGLLFYKDGKIGIGTENPDMKLTVKGSIHAREVKLDLTIPVPDYVFGDDYSLMPLNMLDEYISENGHLPEVPSAEEFSRNGLNMAEMDMMLLKKVEELTLYLIANNERLNMLDDTRQNPETAHEIINQITEKLDCLEKQINSAKNE